MPSPDRPDLRRQQRRSQASALVSVLGLAVFAGALVYGGWRVADVEARVGEIEAEAAGRFDSLQEVEAALSLRVDSLRRAAEVLQDTLEEVSPALAEQTVAYAQEQAEQLVAEIERNPDAQRVYLHVGTPEQRPRAERLRAWLEAEGYIVPSIERVAPRRMPRQSDLRFFRPPDRAAARQIQAALREDLGLDLRLNDRTAYAVQQKAPPRHLEIWLSP